MTLVDLLNFTSVSSPDSVTETIVLKPPASDFVGDYKIKFKIYLIDYPGKFVNYHVPLSISCTVSKLTASDVELVTSAGNLTGSSASVEYKTGSIPWVLKTYVATIT